MMHLLDPALHAAALLRSWTLPLLPAAVVSAAATIAALFCFTPFGRAMQRLRELTRRNDDLRRDLGVIATTRFEGLWRLDAAARTVFANERMAQLLDTRVHDMLGVPVFTLLVAESAERLRPHMRGDDPPAWRDGELQLRRRDGSVVAVNVTVDPLRNEIGAVTGFMLHAVDRTERNALALALARSDARQTALADALGHAVFTTDARGAVVWANRVWCECAGLGEAQMIADWTSALHPNDTGLYLSEWRSALQTGSPFAATVRVRDAAGDTYRWYAAHSAPLPDTRDGAARFVHAWTDIDAYVNARGTAELLGALGHLVVASTGLTDVTYVSPAIAAPRYAADGALPADGARSAGGWPDLVHPDDLALIERGDPAEIRLLTAAGAPRWCSFVPVDAPAPGSPGPRMFALTDIDAHKQAVAARERSDARYTALTRALPLLVWTVDERNTVVDVNERWPVYVGHAPEPGSTLASTGIVHPDDADVAARMNGPARTDAAFELRLRRHDGSFRWHTVRLAALDGSATSERIAVALDIETRKVAELALSQSTAHLMHRAHHDPVTNLPDRTRLLNRLGRTVAARASTGGTVAVFCIGIDNFKAIDATLGLPAGDRVLVETAARIRSVLGDEGIVSRSGRDEFVAVGGTAVTAARIAQTLVRALREPLVIIGNRLVAPCSIGVSCSPHDGTDAATLVAAADAALAGAKGQGGNSWCRANAGDRKAAGAAALALDLELRDALAAEQFVMHYQPVFELGSGRPVGAEALVRWAHPMRGLVPPDEFIPFAEAHGLIVPIGAFALDAACAQLARLSIDSDADFAISVNVSARELEQPNFVATLVAAAELHAVDVRRLGIEITERLALTDSRTVNATFTRLAQLGVKIAIDDFGTGYSSLAYLKRFPIHALKLDRSFVTDVADHATDRAIAQTVIGLGATLGMRIVAEGVETAAQLAELRTLGADCVQGFLWSRPLPAQQFEHFISSGRRGTHLNER